MDNLDPDVKRLFDDAGISEQQLQDEDTAKFIYDFIENHKTALKQQPPARPPAIAPPMPQPPVPQPAIPSSGETKGYLQSTTAEQLLSCPVANWSFVKTTP